MGSERPRIAALLRGAVDKVWHGLAANRRNSLASADRSLKVSGERGGDGAVSGEAERSGAIPLVHRLAIIYLMLPLVIWLIGWHQWWLGIPVAVAIAVALGPSLAGPWRVSPRPILLILLAFAACWVMATAAGGVFDAHNSDWDKHRAILLDLARGSWPVRLPLWVSDLAIYFPGEVELTGYLLRYYLGYYIVPALLAKWFGVAALNWAVALWTWSGVALILLLFTRGFSRWKAIAAASILILFSGMDVARTIRADGLDWFKVWEWAHVSIGPGIWPTIVLGLNHPEWDAPLNYRIHYFSIMHNLAWVPQHFIAAGLYALLLVQLRRHERFLPVSAVLVAGSLFWSPFTALGVMPLVVLLLAENGVMRYVTWQNVLVALPLTGLLIGYLTSGFSEVPHGWVWEFIGESYVLRVLPIIYLTEFLLLVLLLLMLRPRLAGERVFIVTVGTLLLLPLYVYGELNDLVMRGLMPAVILLSYYCARTVLGEHGVSWTLTRAALTATTLAVLCVGLLTVMFEFVRASNDRDFRVVRYEELGRDYSVLRDVSPAYQNQYIAHETPGWYGALLGAGERMNRRISGKGNLIIRSDYEVYLNEHLLVYVRDGCDESEMETQFFVEALPLDSDTLPDDRKHHSFKFEFRGHGWRRGETCVAVRELPSWFKAGHIKTGQLNAERTAHKWLAHYFSEEYRDRLLGAAGEPVIRSTFSVYLDEKRVIYSKASCRESDVESTFQLEVTPVDVEYLPEKFRQAGKETVAFAFTDFGGMLGEGCLLIQELPAYPVKAIKTGQYTPAGGIVWQGHYTILE